MGQIFRPRANVIAKVGAIGFVYLLILVLLSLAAFDRSHYIRRINVPRQQPAAVAVPFTHQVHAGVLGLDCLYCHTAAERSAFADLPSLDSCLACHSEIQTSLYLEKLSDMRNNNQPLEWMRVTDLPEFVYFNHSIHVRGRGIDCETCHGDVPNMPLMWKSKTLYMGFCLDCHRTWKIEQITNCSVCHR
jgi:hypothetical protein